MKKALTIRDIAEKAGVSLGTVSRVMNNAANINPALRERTLAVMRQNNYIPLRRPRRNSRRNAVEGGRIAVLFFDISISWTESYFSRSYADGIREVCAAYRVEMEFFTLPDLCGERFYRQLQEFDGILIKHMFLPGDEQIDRINALAEKVPVIGFGTGLPFCRYPQVFLDERAAGSLAAKELIARGHRVVAFINCDPENETFRSRGAGFRETMQAHGLWIPELFFERRIVTVRPRELDLVPPLLDRTLERILAFSDKVTATVVVNDWGCVGFYRACAARSIRIPEEMSVLGFDNQISICASLNPPLSSISNPLFDIGKTAAWELLSRIDAGNRGINIPPCDRRFTGTIVKRESILCIQSQPEGESMK